MNSSLPLLVLTGAGISSESGVPTFRGENGLWKTFRPEELATPDAFARHPDIVWEWYDERRAKIAACEPNKAHHLLAEIERLLVNSAGRTGESSGIGRGAGTAAVPYQLVTQNVDGLHERAGSKEILRLHGSIWESRCAECAVSRTVDSRTYRPSRTAEDRPLERRSEGRSGHRCETCGGRERPGVVWFGESLEPEVLRRAEESARAARTVLVIGTSSLVYPAALLPAIALDAGARVIEINPERTPLSPLVHEHLAGPACEQLPKWWAKIKASFAS